MYIYIYIYIYIHYIYMTANKFTTSPTNVEAKNFG